MRHDDLELVRGPRGPRECARIACAAPASHQVGLDIACRIRPAAVTHARMGLYVCAVHARATVLADVMSDAGWEQICAGFAAAGAVRPDRELTRLVLYPLSGTEPN